MTSLTLATWNIRKCIGLDRRRDPHRIASVIASLEADVVALQEADKRLGRRPAALTTDIVEREIGMEPADAGGHDCSIGWHGNAILLAPHLKVAARHSIHLPGIEPRGALAIDVSGKGKSLRIVAVHLGLMRSSRRQQLATIRTRLEAMDEMPTVIMGDFNEWSTEHGLEALTGFEVHSPGRTYHSSRPVAALDRFALNGGVTLTDASVIENRVTRVASDHLPIKARVRF
ncbi:metal-dependent hydrolase [Silicimonas algicola]|uniref:Endonuclease/exonuclease/phosphatase family metal-dependent hydrolase n=1 Tax=Silicimonas algicola TaxID=1826607 RepID=A0A316GDH7_9RHOB|nr:endonuclease/exonuclease/phosphatase family protein [Silicimonas algicola]AZQ66585.1 metal-dependent hydrolase [Silicimonas algicola]PWK58928.1 endonuclease/exonuclease/phosphatase family metal-dependent hydrolase [Silicimonas algicola]